MDQPEKLPALYKEMLSRATTDEDFNTVAWMAVEAPMPHRDLQVAHEAIQQALDKMQRSDAAILDTAARVYYLLGFLDRAVEYAQQAAHAEIASKEEKKSMQVMLAFYKEALSMHERIKNAAASSADTGSADTE
jgi:tetratricopeptide (TPR) repeat protein